MHQYQCRFICIVILHHVNFREIILKMKLSFMSKSEMAFSSEAILVWQINLTFINLMIYEIPFPFCTIGMSSGCVLNLPWE